MKNLNNLASKTKKDHQCELWPKPPRMSGLKHQKTTTKEGEIVQDIVKLVNSYLIEQCVLDNFSIGMATTEKEVIISVKGLEIPKESKT